MLTVPSKQNLLKPEMGEDLKCPNARTTWEHHCCLQSSLDLVFWGRGCPQSPAEAEGGLHCSQALGRGDRAASGFGPPFRC